MELSIVPLILCGWEVALGLRWTPSSLGREQERGLLWDTWGWGGLEAQQLPSPMLGLLDRRVRKADGTDRDSSRLLPSSGITSHPMGPGRGRMAATQLGGIGGGGLRVSLCVRTWAR